MVDFKKLFSIGRNNTVALTNKSGFSYNGPWKTLYENTTLDRWYSGDFSAAEIVVAIDFDTDNKEVIKALICNSVNSASISVYGRNNLGNDLADIDIQVNQSYVDLLISPKENSYRGAKFIYSASFFQNINPLSQ